MDKGDREMEQLQLSFDHQQPPQQNGNGYCILYKKDTKGKIRTLEMWTENNLLVNFAGLEDGKKVRTEAECQGKNQGKKNETTDAEQALKELEAKKKKKLREGYCTSLEEAKEGAVEKPMLAHSYWKDGKLTTHAKKIDWTQGVWVQHKLAGMRSKGKPGQNYKLFSRTNKEITTLSHITNRLSGQEITLDGELYAHGFNFQENMRMIKKYRMDLTEKVKWHVYDIQADLCYADRQALLVTWYEKQPKEVQDVIELVPTFHCSSLEELKQYHVRFISEGYEGTMIRHSNKPYKVNGRCSSLLKYKDFIDITAELIDVIPEDRRTTFGKALCRTVNEQGEEIEFLASFKASHEEREEYLSNKDHYIGKVTLEIRFFEWTTSEQPVPRFPVLVKSSVHCPIKSSPQQRLLKQHSPVTQPRLSSHDFIAEKTLPSVSPVPAFKVFSE